MSRRTVHVHSEDYYPTASKSNYHAVSYFDTREGAVMWARELKKKGRNAYVKKSPNKPGYTVWAD